MSGDEQLPEDLRDIAARLAGVRVIPTPLELDELRRRLRSRVDRDGAASRRVRLATNLAARLLPLGLLIAAALGLVSAGSSAVGAGAAKHTTIAFLNAGVSSPDSASCTQYGGCCPPGTNLDFQWRYSGGGSTSAWNSITCGPCPGRISLGEAQGKSNLSPGATVEVGYELEIPGNTSTVKISVSDAAVTFPVACVSGNPTASTFTVTMPSATYSVSGSGWYPGATYEGSAAVPNDCHGGLVDLQAGGSIQASVST